jgi:hypothetical protein
MGAASRHSADGMRLRRDAHRTRIRSRVAQRPLVRRAASQVNNAAHHTGQMSRRGQTVRCRKVRPRKRLPQQRSQSESLRPALLLLSSGDVGPGQTRALSQDEGIPFPHSLCLLLNTLVSVPENQSYCIELRRKHDTALILKLL